MIPRSREMRSGNKTCPRGLIYIWMSKKLSREFLNIQDEYLTEESRRKGITDLSQLRPLAPDNRLYLWQGDMTTLRVDGLA